MKLLLLIPAKDEARNLGAVLKKVPKKFTGISSFEVLVVDDGSTDGTADVAKKNGATVRRHQYNRGVGAAFKTGVTYALEQKFDVMVNMDGDGQFDPKDVDKLLKPILAGKADFVTASRFSGDRKHDEFIRHVGNKMFTWLISTLIGKTFTDTQCGFRAYTREALLRLNVMGDFTYTQEVFLDLAAKNVRAEEVPVTVYARLSGKSRVAKNVIVYGVRALKIVMRSFRDYRPLTFFGIPGLIIFSLGCLVWLGCLVYYLTHFLVTPIRTYLFVGGGLVYFGFLMIILAVLADMLDRHRRLQEEVLYQLRRR
jgi:glycosyltransferase involved in cell wall biosynthesis